MSTHRCGQVNHHLEIAGESQITSESYLDFRQFSVIAEGTGTIETKWEFDSQSGLTRKLESRTKMDVEAMPIGLPNAELFLSKIKVYGKRELDKVK